jgi:hypothetical protein
LTRYLHCLTSAFNGAIIFELALFHDNYYGILAEALIIVTYFTCLNDFGNCPILDKVFGATT